MDQGKIYLYNKSFFLASRLKESFKKLLGKSFRGPEAVFKSLLSGFNELNINYNINQSSVFPIGTACIISNAEVLKWAINQKKKGLIKKIVAGPNIIVAPTDSEGILNSDLIDKIIVPSEWVKDFYVSVSPQLFRKIFIWPAGVELPEESNAKKEIDFLVYSKVKQDVSLANGIIKELTARGFKVKALAYGSFEQQEYFNLLNITKYLIYLSESESQGLAMFEAWARNVPTFIWERGFMEYQNYRFEANTATPYLSEESGMRFKDFNEFTEKLEAFTKENYTPREYIKKNFNLKLSAQKYLDIINA